ncbi:AbrB/MazE/SpoVT family DNA-binding domain-containing protein [Methylobacterium crusticola]|uniref:AbrB/MazE/SpoVT family DNA-binding domain-containing protein n=1 Tax=Methylobacterium crusticola TaxID=1697972 RepID=UPI000FFBEEEC|nr:AbrB/MazE/SpoVT family DNA-binding domain-containing protein [Methylobacterium crusticola]
MDFKAEFDKLRKTATEGFDQAKELAGGLAEKAVDVVQDRVGAVTGKMAGAEPIRSWNSTVATTLEGKNTIVRLPVEMVKHIGWKNNDIVTFSLLADGSVSMKKYVAEVKT